MRDRDFEIWKKSPKKFYSRNCDTFHNIISKKIFTGHRNSRELEQLYEDIRKEMYANEVVIKLLDYHFKSSFLVYYINVLKEVVTNYSQNEDLELLDKNFRRLILKYYPLITQICGKKLFPCDSLKGTDFENDLNQQIFVNLIYKEEKIKSYFNRKHLFRNYLWAIIIHECSTMIKAELDRKEVLVNREDLWNADKLFENNPSYYLALEDAYGLSEIWINSYLQRKHKLTLCFKISFDLQINREDIGRLLQQDFSLEEISKHYPSVGPLLEQDSEDKPETAQKRFNDVKSLLNAADRSNTGADSYWRWTNYQIDRMIDFLNRRHSMNFNRKTVKTLIEWYFEKFVNS
ncbi:MAG: hypothetical protein K9I94_00220 [Bacteroidales bacterium]|nr:hypothetical protein [Bacteroidales bacterium]